MICVRTRVICGLGWVEFNTNKGKENEKKRVTTNAIIVVTFTEIYSIWTVCEYW